MQEKYEFCHHRQYMELIKLPKDYKCVGCKWVIRTKIEIVRYKMVGDKVIYSHIAEVKFNKKFIHVAKVYHY